MGIFSLKDLKFLRVTPTFYYMESPVYEKKRRYFGSVRKYNNYLYGPPSLFATHVEDGRLYFAFEYLAPNGKESKVFTPCYGMSTKVHHTNITAISFKMEDLSVKESAKFIVNGLDFLRLQLCREYKGKSEWDVKNFEKRVEVTTECVKTFFRRKWFEEILRKDNAKYFEEREDAGQE